MSDLKEKILFVKPFEIESSYSFFNMVWTKIKKVFADTKEVSSFALLRSVDAAAKYGFVSISAWDSKDAFARAVKNNIVLKYHISKNGEEKESDSLYLYRTLLHEAVSPVRQGNAFYVEFIKNSENTRQAVEKRWKRFNELFKESGVLQSSRLCKSVSVLSGYSYVIIAALSIGNTTTPAAPLRKIVAANKNKVKNSYNSFYNKNFKTIIPNKY